MTLTVIESRYPRELFRYIREEEQGEVVESAPGIYRIMGYNLDIQVIENRKLPLEGNLWLKGLTRDRIDLNSPFLYTKSLLF